MASKNNQQRNDEGNRINRAGATISNQGIKALQSSPMFQRKQIEHDALSSSSLSNNKKKQNKSSPTKTDKSNSANRIGRGEAILSNESMKELQNSPKFQKKQSEHNAPSSKLSDRAPKKRSKIKKVLDKFTNIIKRPTKTIKSSLGMNSNQKTMSYVDKLHNQRNSEQSKKSTRSR